MMVRISRLKSSGFTLIELLVVILVIAVLVAIAAPSFLGQTSKAQDSVAKQNLSLSWKAAISNATSNPAGQGRYFSAATLAGPASNPNSIKASEPALTVTSGTYSDADTHAPASPSRIFVSPADAIDGPTTPTNYVAFARSNSGTVWCIIAPSGGQQTIEKGSGCPGYTGGGDGGPPVNVDLPVVAPNIAVQGSALTTDNGTWSGTSPITYTVVTWERCDSTGDNCTNIAGTAGDHSYTPGTGDLNKRIRVVIHAHNTYTHGGSSTAGDAEVESVPTDLVYDPDNPGPIAYRGSNSAGQTGIYTMDSNGTVTSRTHILTDADAGGTVDYPSWSPDGRKIVYLGPPDPGYSGSDVYIMDANGTNSVQLTHYRYTLNACGSSEDVGAPARPHFSPDGRSIALTLDPRCISYMRHIQILGLNSDQTDVTSSRDIDLTNAVSGVQWLDNNNLVVAETNPQNIEFDAVWGCWSGSQWEIDTWGYTVVVGGIWPGCGAHDTSTEGLIVPLTSGTPSKQLTFTHMAWTRTGTGSDISGVGAPGADPTHWDDHHAFYTPSASINGTIYFEGFGSLLDGMIQGLYQFDGSSAIGTSLVPLTASGTNGSSTWVSNVSWSPVSNEFVADRDGIIRRSPDGHDEQVICDASMCANPSWGRYSAPTGGPSNYPPVNISLPQVTGIPYPGQTLAATHGTWSSDANSFTYSWESCLGSTCTSLGDTRAYYTVSLGDLGSRIRVQVTATNDGDKSTTVRSPASDEIVIDPTLNTAAPQISGTAQVGATLSGTKGSWTANAATFTYEWQRCDATGNNCVNISGATGTTFPSSYTLQSADVGHTVLERVTMCDWSDSCLPVPSSASNVVTFSNTSLPTITGANVLAHTLTAGEGSWSVVPDSFSYQWRRCNSSGDSCADISSQVDSTYVLGSNDVGSTIRVSVTARLGGQSVSARSNATEVVTDHLTYAGVILGDNPSGYWRLGEGSGSSAQDSAGSNTGTYQGSPTLGADGALTGSSNTALGPLNGSSQYVSVPDSSSLRFGNTFTIEAWVKPTNSSGDQAILSKGYAGLLLRIYNGRIDLLSSEVRDLAQSTQTVPVGEWSYVVATKDGSTIHLYLNGQDVTGSTQDYTFSDNTTPLAIGIEQDGSYWPYLTSYSSASLDEVAVYNHALTETQVGVHYSAGTG